MTAPVQQMITPAGDPAWLVTRYDIIKQLLVDSRLGRSHPEPEKASRYSDAVIMGQPEGSPETEHSRYTFIRRLLSRSFSARRMAAMRPRVQELVDGFFDDIVRLSPPVDLHEVLAFPLPAIVICELLGVPYEDRDDFRRWSDDSVDTRDAERSRASLAQLHSYMRKLMARKREAPAEDILSDMVAAQREAPDVFTDDRATELAAGVLFAGHETTVAAIDRGVVLLLTDPDQRAALERDPALLPSAVEEILRVRSPVPAPPTRLARYANADIDVGDVFIRAGDLVLFELDDGNLDEQVFPEPATFDITRAENQHLIFGHGIHFCPGAPLARIELQAVFGTLFQRLPTLRLAVPIDELRCRDYILTGGLEELPVTWDV